MLIMTISFFLVGWHWSQVCLVVVVFLVHTNDFGHRLPSSDPPELDVRTLTSGSDALTYYLHSKMAIFIVCS